MNMALFGPKTSDQPVATAGQPQCGPGAQLVQARERWGMSREQVANTLRLPQRIIAALEQDHYQDLPPPAFVRGYISGYARLVGLDADPLVAACEMQGCGDPALASKHSLSLRRGRGETLLRWGSYAVLAAFLGSAMLYWAGTEEDSTVLPITALPSMPQDKQSGGMDGLSTATTDDREPTSMARTSTAANSILGGETPAYDNPERTAANTLSTAEYTQDTATSDETNRQADNIPATDWPTLELKFIADSWLAVRDADGKRLAWETVKSGSSRQIQGEPPLKVVIGNVEAVHISFQGESFDASPFTKGRMARFSVE